MATQNFYKSSVNNLSDVRKIIFNAGVEASLEYFEPKRNIVPKMQLLFSPYGLPFIPIEVIGSSVQEVISNLSWTKDRNNPGGMLSVTITPDSKTIQDIVDIINKYSKNLYSKIWGELGVDLEDLFKPMTLCQFWMNGYHVMTGKVRACSRSAAVSNKDKSLSYTVTIDELGALYDEQIVSFDTNAFDGMQANVLDSTKEALVMSSTIKGVPLSVGINSLCTAFLSTFLKQGVSLSDGFSPAFRLIAIANPFGGLANLSFSQNMIVDMPMFELAGGQSFWGFLKNFIPNPWMELFTESGGRTLVTDVAGVPSVLFPGFNYIVARSVPYSNPLLGTVNPIHIPSTLPFDLTAIQLLLFGDFIIITDDDISEKHLGVDSSNQYTVFHTRYGAGSGIVPADNDDKPIHSVGPMNPFASGGVATFGVKDMFQSINCSHLINLGTVYSYVERILKNTIGANFTMMSKPALSNLLAVWFRNQSRFREGSVTTRPIPYARPGMYCLYLPSHSGKKPENLRDIGIYYIDSLNHNFTLSNNDVSATTTLNLIRGVPLPTTLAQSALRLFDFELLPPESGVLNDGEWSILSAARNISKVI